jgi:hypothetical protein
MNVTGYMTVLELETNGKFEAAGQLLLTLVESNDPLALIEYGNRNRMDPSEFPGHHMPGKDEQKAAEYIARGISELERLAACGDGEAMRQMGYLCLGFYGLEFRSTEAAEQWLLKAYEAGCYFAANDLHCLYLGSDAEKSQHWYDEAERHGCRVVFHPALYTPLLPPDATP